MALALVCGDYLAQAEATIIKVPSDQPTIQAGINASAKGDTILVESGIYVENINFNGKEIVVGSFFILTGDTSYISQTVIRGNQTASVVTFANGEDSTAVLSGFTITGGVAFYGGGIFCLSSNPTLAKEHGSGIYCQATDVNLVNSIVWYNLPDQVYFNRLDSPSSVNVAHSNIENGLEGISDNGNGTVNWLPGNMETEPLFADSRNGDFHLQNYPNPFNPTTTISFGIAVQSAVSLKVFDVLGREVATILSQELLAGNYDRQWNAENFPGGIYFCRLQTGNSIKTRKLLLLK
jgi:hypothetical protein